MLNPLNIIRHANYSNSVAGVFSLVFPGPANKSSQSLSPDLFAQVIFTGNSIYEQWKIIDILQLQKFSDV